MASAVILAGGASTRMQTNKALVELGGQRMIDRIINRLRLQFDEIIVVTNEPQLFSDVPARVTTDVYPRCGPLSGIHSGLLAITERQALITACDMPFISLELASYLLANLGSYQAMVPVYNNKLQSLFAVYDRSVAMVAERLLQEGQWKLRDLFTHIHYQVVDKDQIAVYGDPELMFTNINTRDSLEHAKLLLGM